MALNRQKLTKRAGTAVLGVFALFMFVIILPQWCLHVLLVALAGVGVREFENIAQGCRRNPACSTTTDDDEFGDAIFR